MKQGELNLGPRSKKPMRGQIDRQEYAIIKDRKGKRITPVHGTYEEIEYYCENNGFWVDRYLDHVDPMTVQAHFRYVGSGHNPCDVATPFWSEKIDPVKGTRVPREFKEKW